MYWAIVSLYTTVQPQTPKAPTLKLLETPVITSALILKIMLQVTVGSYLNYVEKPFLTCTSFTLALIVDGNSVREIIAKVGIIFLC